MERKEKLLLEELIQGGGETVTACIAALEDGECLSALPYFDQESVESLHEDLTEFLAGGGSETHGPTFVSSRIEHASKEGAKNIHYLALFAGQTLCWKVAITDEDPELEMSDAYVL